MNSMSDDERWFEGRLVRELDAAIISTDPGAVATRAMSHPHSRVVGIAFSVAAIAAAILFVGFGSQILSAFPRQLPGQGVDASPSSKAVTKGPIPAGAWNEDGTINWAVMPDYIPATNGDLIAGWVRTEEVFRPEGSRSTDVIPVYADDLQTLVGHLYPDVGFVPLGRDPDSAARSSPEARSSSAP